MSVCGLLEAEYLSVADAYPMPQIDEMVKHLCVLT